MGVFWGANQTERSLREGMIHVYFACLQDTCGVNMLNVWRKHGGFLGCKSNRAKFTRRYDTRLFRVFTGHVWRKHVKFFFRA